MLHRGTIGVIDGNVVGRRVVEGRQEQGVFGNHDAACEKAGAHVGRVEQRGEQPGIDLARIAAAGPAMECTGMRVVDDTGAVAGDQHQPRETIGERHGPEDGFGHLDPLVEADRVGRPWRRVVRCGIAGEPQRVAKKLADIDWPRRLDEGEGGDGGELEATPGTLGTGRDPCRAIRALGLRRLLSRAGEETGPEQNGQAGFHHIRAEATMRDPHAEETGEAQGADAGIERF